MYIYKMKKALLAVLLLCNSIVLFAQSSLPKDSILINPDSIYVDVDIKAEYPGGHKGWSDFIEKKINGQVATDNGAPAGTYTVVIACIIGTDGKLIAAAPLTSHGYGMEREMLRVLNKIPKAFIPAYKNGIPVKSKLKFPLTFSVGNTKATRF